MINRRQMISAGAALVLVRFGAQAQRAPPWRIGVLTIASRDSPEMRDALEAFRQGLRDYGHVDDVVFEYRDAGGAPERLPGAARELERLKVDIIAAGNTLVARAAAQATTGIPIVALFFGDPSEEGLVASLARPGGKMTGVTALASDLIPKRMELIRVLLPTSSRIGLIRQPDEFGTRTTYNMLNEAETAARKMNIQLVNAEARNPDDLEAAFATIAGRSDALLVFHSNVFFIERKRIVDLAAKHRLPTIHFIRQFAEVGGLISYGPSIHDLIRHTGGHVDKILKGARAGDLPIEQPTKFELVINLRTAAALGLTVPNSLRLRADEVIA